MEWANHRLLHSPSLVAIGLSVEKETWPPIGWHHPSVIGWSKYRLGLPCAPLHYGLTWPVGIPSVFQTPVTVPLHFPNGRQMPVVRFVQGDCDSVYARQHLSWLLSRYPVMKSSLCSLFEDWAPGDLIHGSPTFKWPTATKLNDRAPWQ